MNDLRDSLVRYLSTLISSIWLLSTQAHACFAGLESSLFFVDASGLMSDADVIATVSVSDVKGTLMTGSGTAKITVLDVFKATDSRVQSGKEMVMKYGFSSCGPSTFIGAKGMVIAKTGTDSEGQPVLFPYSRNGDGQISPPFAQRSISKLPSMKPDDLAKLNASCAAFYDVVKGVREPKWREDFLYKFNAHKLYAQRLYGGTEYRFDTEFSRERKALERTKIEKKFTFQAWVEKCVSVEFSTPLLIKEHRRLSQ